jgi:hypothetical protein
MESTGSRPRKSTAPASARFVHPTPARSFQNQDFQKQHYWITSLFQSRTFPQQVTLGSEIKTLRSNLTDHAIIRVQPHPKPSAASFTMISVSYGVTCIRPVVPTQ